ncbi:MAG: redox-regulated ATPase YchF [Candidatus Anoxymicrobium japonicum]|uniref:Ribosome-binding ATPase YchF n=1 Tax=Candidatus Anoxymicrobium japonicum TaxID=2013648 RepID=A0A2N3G554_9ACTN|nr:MAG: redox-regulated ATPase YchF [Candidatus Anoxymicrobium japonicum]
MSSLKVGIVGLPNAGKTTLFNALSRGGALVASYPFATIEPNTGVVSVPDPRLAQFSRLADSARIVPATVRFIDIAGLVEGASKGEGLGNRFLASIREVDAVAHVVRGFEAEDVSHVVGATNPARDAELIETELRLSDLEILARELKKARSAAKDGVRESVERVEALEKIEERISSEVISDRASVARELALHAPDTGLLILKPTVIVLNIDEPGDVSARFEREMNEWAQPRGIPVLSVNARIEAELADLDPEEATLFAREMGIEEESLGRIVSASYELLGLITFFTVGPKESRAWPIRAGSTARQAAGRIHTDFERGFIKAEVVPGKSFISCGSVPAAREAGAFRLEGREYIVQDGDVINFKFAT